MMNRELYIDMAKAVAILAVLVNHTNGLLYTNQNIALLSYFNVSLFIILLGITTFFSFSHTTSIRGSIATKCKRIIASYVVASIIYFIVVAHCFDLERIINELVHFSVSIPLYYVLLYLQLIIIAPILFKMISSPNTTVLLEIVCGIIVVFLSYLTTNYSNILSVYGGGGKLFGATYLILFYFGMVFAKYSYSFQVFLQRKKWVLYMLFTFSVVMLILWARFLMMDQFSIDARFPFMTNINPPGISLMVYSVIVFFHIFLLCISVPLEAIPVIRLVAVGGRIIGRHTLYIFLYHMFFMSTVIPFFLKDIGKLSAWVIRIVYLTFMTVGPICLEKIFAKVRQAISVAYQ